MKHQHIKGIVSRFTIFVQMWIVKAFLTQSFNFKWCMGLFPYIYFYNFPTFLYCCQAACFLGNTNKSYSFFLVHFYICGHYQDPQLPIFVAFLPHTLSKFHWSFTFKSILKSCLSMKLNPHDKDLCFFVTIIFMLNFSKI